MDDDLLGILDRKAFKAGLDRSNFIKALVAKGDLEYSSGGAAVKGVKGVKGAKGVKEQNRSSYVNPIVSGEFRNGNRMTTKDLFE